MKLIQFVKKWQDRQNAQWEDLVKNWKTKLDPREGDDPPRVTKLDRIESQYLEITERKRAFIVYKLVMRRLLKRLDRVLGPPASDKAFIISWDIALIYPVVLAIIAWIFSDQNILGIDGFLDNTGTPFWHRALIALGLTITPVLFFPAIIPKKRRVWYLIGLTSFIFFGIGATAIAFVVAAAIAIRLTASRAVAVALTGVTAVSFAGAASLAIDVTGSYHMTFAAAFALAVVVYGVFVYLIKQLRYISVNFSFALILLFTSGFAVWSFSSLDGWEAKQNAGLLFTMAVLPIVNAIFDCISVGLTRILLSASLRSKKAKWMVVYSTVDLLAATLCLIGLCFALPFVIQCINFAGLVGGGNVQMDVQNILYSLNDNGTIAPMGLLWIYVMVLTTFIPTLAHFSIVIFAIAASKNYSAKKQICLQYIQEVKQNNYDRLQEAAVAMADIQRGPRVSPIVASVLISVILITAITAASNIWIDFGWAGYGAANWIWSTGISLLSSLPA